MVGRCDDVSHIYRSESGPNSNSALISGLPERSLRHNIGACPGRAKALRHRCSVVCALCFFCLYSVPWIARLPDDSLGLYNVG